MGMVFAAFTSKAATINLAYPNAINDYIWISDGFGDLTEDCRVGAAIKITRDMYSQYVGAKFTSLKIGWSDNSYSSKCTIFVRKELTDTIDILSGSGTLKWTSYNNQAYQGQYTTISFKNPDGLTLTDSLGDYFYVGCIVEKLKKNTHPIASVGYQNQKGSAYLWRDMEGENYDSEGRQIWEDCCSQATLCMGLVVTGTFTNRVQITDLVTYPTQLAETADDGMITLANRGTNDVSSLTFEYKCGDTVKTEKVTLSQKLASGTSKTIMVPIWALGDGDHTITLSKVGTAKNYFNTPRKYQTIAVPEAVSKKYKRTPLVEFFESEDSYYVPQYYDEYFIPGYENYKSKCTLVSHHLDDQWMLDDDAATRLMLQMSDNDSTALYIPSIAVDRSANLPLYSLNIDHVCPYHAIILPDFASYLYDDALARPTFADIDVEAQVEDDVLNVTVEGDIAENIIKDQSLYVTVYLLEDDVYTDSQQQQELEKGDYFHDNLQRARLTGPWGDKLDVKSGHYEMKFHTDLYPEEWDYEKMRVVVTINQADETQAATDDPKKAATTNDKWNRSILNSASCSLTLPEGIDGVKMTKKTGACYDLQGRKARNLQRGLYIVNGEKIINKK